MPGAFEVMCEGLLDATCFVFGCILYLGACSQFLHKRLAMEPRARLLWMGRNAFGCGSNPMGSHFGVGAPPILVNFSGDGDVHWGYEILTHGHFAPL